MNKQSITTTKVVMKHAVPDKATTMLSGSSIYLSIYLSIYVYLSIYLSIYVSYVVHVISCLSL